MFLSISLFKKTCHLQVIPFCSNKKIKFGWLRSRLISFLLDSFRLCRCLLFLVLCACWPIGICMSITWAMKARALKFCAYRLEEHKWLLKMRQFNCDTPPHHHVQISIACDRRDVMIRQAHRSVHFPTTNCASTDKVHRWHWLCTALDWASACDRFVRNSTNASHYREPLRALVAFDRFLHPSNTPASRIDLKMVIICLCVNDKISEMPVEPYLIQWLYPWRVYISTLWFLERMPAQNTLAHLWRCFALPLHQIDQGMAIGAV